MIRVLIPTLVVAALLTPSVRAQNPLRFRWVGGQALTYRVEQTTVIDEVIGEKKTTITNKLRLTKRWQVESIDPTGVATLRLSLTALRNEIIRPNGEVLLYDSQARDQSTPELVEQMAKYVGQSLALLRVDTRGSVVEVKESNFGPGTRYESEPPFKVVLAEEEVAVGGTWPRTYNVTLEPPAGTGEKYPASQQFTLKSAEGAVVGIGFVTTLKLPETPLDQVPLLQALPTGEVVFDPTLGVVKSVRIRVDREVKGHQGEGSSYRFQSTVSEDLVNGR